MENILNLGFAKISLILTFLLSIIYVLRVVNGNMLKGKKTPIDEVNKVLRKYHKIMGITLIITGLIHGIFSSDSVISLNLGTISWIVSALLGLNYCFKKRLSKIRPWIFYHRILTIIFVIITLLHIADVKHII